MCIVCNSLEYLKKVKQWIGTFTVPSNNFKGTHSAVNSEAMSVIEMLFYCLFFFFWFYLWIMGFFCTVLILSFVEVKLSVRGCVSPELRFEMIYNLSLIEMGDLGKV